MATARIDPAHHVWHTSEAEAFTESCPLGNGRLGMMVFGCVKQEHIVLNESTMWSGSPQDGDRSDARRQLPKIRELLFQGKNWEAQQLVQESMVCAGQGSGYGNGAKVPFGCYQVFGTMTLDFGHTSFRKYKRILDLRDAVATTSYRFQNHQFEREAFVSYPAQVGLLRVRCIAGNGVTFVLRLDRAERASTRRENSDLVLSGQLDAGQPGHDGVRFEGRVRVRTLGGRVEVFDDRIEVTSAREAVLMFSAGTSLADPDFRSTTLYRLDLASSRPYNDLKHEHVESHRSLYDRCRLDLPKGPKARSSTPERLAAVARGDEDPSLAALMFHFGRYLLISSSRQDSPLPANLQGLWAEEIQTPWNGDFHLNINLQMNYWLSETTNLAECHTPLLKWILRLQRNGARTARAYYDAHGWVAHVISNPWHFTSPGEGASWGSTLTGGAWLCQHLMEHYRFGGDKSWLSRAYPALHGAAEFFLDALVQDPNTGWLVTAPSNSPENSFLDEQGRAVQTCMGPTIDTQIVKELFGNVIKANEVLRQSDPLCERLCAVLPKLPPMQIGSQGQLLEWLKEVPEAEPRHRHVSHLYGLHPGDQITPERTPDLAAAARKSLELRGDEGTGWSLAWKVCFWARLGDGARAAKLLTRFCRPTGAKGYEYSSGGGCYPNLFCAHPPFQIDGNFGAAAGIAEMLVQSHEGKVNLLPAMPASWGRTGYFRGMRVRGGHLVDCWWKDGRVTRMKITRGWEPLPKVVRQPNGSTSEEALTASSRG